MSGNPFRRSQAVGSSTEQPFSDSSQFAGAFLSQNKRVAIDTPPHTSESASIPSARSLFPSRGLDASSTADYASRDDISESSEHENGASEQEELNVRGSPPASLPSKEADAPAGAMRAPFNPFARTLASQNSGGGVTVAFGKGARLGSAKQDATHGKPLMDVDAFKNILLTGSTAPLPQNSRMPVAGLQRDGNAATLSFTPSDGPHFDPSQRSHTDSPKSSFDGYRPEFDDIEDYENEDASLMGPLGTRPQELAPRAPPKPKSSKGPQTVSFAEFDESIPPDFLSAGPKPPSLRKQSSGILRPTITRSSSDLNKPLPAPPEIPPPSPGFAVSSENSVPTTKSTLPASGSSEDVPSAKKVPPPPPASRRQANGSGLGRPRSTSNLTQESAPSTPDLNSNFSNPSLTNIDDSTQNKPTVPPPAPPSRKHTSTVSHSSPQASLDVATPTALNDSNSTPKLIPPPPPRRTVSKSGDLNDSTAHASRPSGPFLQNLDSATRRSGSPHSLTSPPAAAPPPPPPRRSVPAGKRASSIEASSLSASASASNSGSPNAGPPFVSKSRGRRPSNGQNSDNNSERSVSVSSSFRLEPVAEPDGEDIEDDAREGLLLGSGVGASTILTPDEDAGQAKLDILADMSAFQAEIDALRERAGAGTDAGL